MNVPSHAPQGRNGQLLYLDFDGVLHCDDVYRDPRRGIYLDAPDTYTLFQHAPLLIDALAPYPEVRIVLSTSWVYVLRFRQALRRLPPALQMRVIGATFHSSMDRLVFQSKSRGVQVLEDVRRRQPRAWLALDNDDHGWPRAASGHLILSNDDLGISEPSVHAQMRREFQRRFGSDNES